MKFDEAVIAEIITAYGTSWEVLGFKEGTFMPQCGGLQGGPRSPGMWKRFYDLLIRAQKLVNKGKLAYITSEDGNQILLTTKVYADDTSLLSGDHANFKARAEMQQAFVNYSGSCVKPPKCILTAIVHELDGKSLRHIEGSENIGFTDLNDRSHKFCKIIGPTDPFRYLGWHSCVSIAVDQAFKLMMVGCNEEVNHIYTRKCTGRELTSYAKIKSLPRVLWRMRYSTTGEDSISRLQILYNKLFRTKSKIIGGFPNMLMYAKEKLCGLGFVNFWDAISIDRVVTYLKHSFTSGEEADIFAAAVKRCDDLQQSHTPALESKAVLPWDGTMLGRVKEWLSKNDFAITGGKQNYGMRENDVAIIDLVKRPQDLKKIIAGCQKSGIFWKSQCVSADGNTWISKLQWNGEFTKTKTKFVWFNTSHCSKTGERIHDRKETLWSWWSSSVKKLLFENKDMSDNLGKYFKDTLPALQPMDVCFSSDINLPKLVIKQVGSIVHYVQCDIPAKLKVTLSRSNSQDVAGYKWEQFSLGISDGSCNDRRIFTTPWSAIKQMQRISVVPVAAQFIPLKIGARNFRYPVMSDAMNGQGTFSNAGAIFFRYAKHSTATISNMLWNNITLNLFQYRLPDLLTGTASLEQFIGEGNAGFRGTPMRNLFPGWKTEANKYKKGGIIAGGDGSAKMLPEGQEAAFAWVVMAIGPLSILDISKKPASYVTTLASGGSADWVIRKFRTNTRAEKLHVLAAMIALLPADLNVWYFVDYSGAISTAIDVQIWIASDWISCEDRDILSAVLYMQQQWENAGLIFKLVKIKAHPENWCHLHVSNYKALHQMAVIQDTAAKAVFTRFHGTGVRPFFPGRAISISINTQRARSNRSDQTLFAR